MLRADGRRICRRHAAADEHLVAQVPWPDAPKTFTPGGFIPSERARGVGARLRARILLAARAARRGRRVPMPSSSLTPIAGALLVWITFLAAAASPDPLAGAMAAVLVATSPPMLFQVVQPMNDVTTAALWMGTFVALLRGAGRLQVSVRSRVARAAEPSTARRIAAVFVVAHRA